MSVPSTAEQFLDLVGMSGLLDRQHLEAYLRHRRAAGAPSDSPQALAEALVQGGLLTRFQAEHLLNGRWKKFILSGKYRVLGPLGSGGMGQVFLCEHLVMRRRVAVKVLPGNSGEPVALERFHREARAVARLNHPNIVSGYDIDQDGDLHFLVMEYIDGNDFHAIVKKKGPLDITRACHYVAQACAGLQHAHEAGLVHRDIKPANLLLDRSGTVKILDLGLVRFFHEDADDLSRRGPGGLLGTSDYMAPEQAIDSHAVDIRADVYSLGATFYFLLAGHGPFPEGPAMIKLMHHRFGQHRPIRELRPDVPEGVAAILDRMMAKDPTVRFQTPAEVSQALALWMRTPIAPPPPDEMPGLTPPGQNSGEALPALPAFLYGPVSALTPQRRHDGEVILSPSSQLPTIPFPEPSAETPSPAATQPGFGPAALAPLTPRPLGGGASDTAAPSPLPTVGEPGSLSRIPAPVPARRRLWTALAAVVLILVAGAAAFVISRQSGGPPPPAAKRLRLLVPAYFYPSGKGLDEWERIIDSPAASATVVILNPESGPGKEADSNYGKVLKRAQQKGVTAIGYVSTNYGKRSLTASKADVDRWILFYPGIQGIFFDEQASTDDQVYYYAALYEYVRKERGLSLVVTNPGTVCAEAYLARPTTDVVCLVEVTKDIHTYSRPAWAADYPPERFAALLYEVGSAGKMKTAISEMGTQRIGYCYITDGAPPNPWDRLPGYWGEEAEAVREVNAR